MGGSVSKNEYVPPTADELVEYKEGEQHSATEPDAEMKIKVAKKGIASRPPTTVMATFEKAVEASGDKVAMRWEVKDDEWAEMTWREYHQRVLQAGRSFIKLGLAPFESVNIIGFNSKEWLIGNCGAIAAGGKAAGIYATNKPDACKYISDHSDARVVLVENEMQLDKFLEIRDSLPKLVAIVQYKGDEIKEGANEDGKAKVYTWAEFMALGAEDAEDFKANDEELKKRIEAQRPGHCSTLIYTR